MHLVTRCVVKRILATAKFAGKHRCIQLNLVCDARKSDKTFVVQNCDCKTEQVKDVRVSLFFHLSAKRQSGKSGLVQNIVWYGKILLS